MVDSRQGLQSRAPRRGALLFLFVLLCVVVLLCFVVIRSCIRKSRSAKLSEFDLMRPEGTMNHTIVLLVPVVT